MGITHKWNGSVLTITSDSGTSSMDLLGPKGDKGCRGPQGKAGCIVDADGNIDMTGYATEDYVDEKLADVPDINNYYTKAETDNAIRNVEVDLTGYATETFVTTKIAAAQLEGADIDMSGYVTKDELNIAVNGAGVGEAGTGTGSEVFNDYDNNIASGDYSHAEGAYTEAIGRWSHTEGYGTKAISSSTHAEGYNTEAKGAYSHAEGAYTEASGEGSHTEGYKTEAIAKYSHAEGYQTRTIGSNSHTEGRGTISEGAMQHVEGEYNAIDFDSHRLQYGVNSFTTTRGKYVHIVGNGTSDTERSNCHTLDWNGNAWFAGKVYVGGTSMDDAVELGTGSGGSADLSNYYTKIEVDNKIASIGSGGSVDLSSYATKTYVSEQIASAQLSGGNVNLSVYATKEYVTGLGYQTEAQVLALIRANMPASGDGVSY